MIKHDEVLEAVLTLLEAEYIFPDKAAEADAAVRAALAAGEFEGLDGAAFCRAVTEVFHRVCADRHLRLMWSDEPQEAEADGEAMFASLSLSVNHGFQRVERLDGNVGYVDLRLVPAPADGGPLFAAAMRLLANTEALIVDLRRNVGGDVSTVTLWCSYFFGGDAVHLNDVYTRKDDSTRQYWTLEHVDGPRYLDRPVYVLIGPATFSGAEEFAYNLKATGRATLVGETTRGGAHPTEWYSITPQITFAAPYARSINPITGTNWEGVGVEPDLAVTADEAFDVAYREALAMLGRNGAVPEGPREEPAPVTAT